jgi:Fe-S-cluster formation regulator IscX/YfhJ
VEIPGEVLWCQAVKAPESQNGDLVVDPLWSSQPVELTEQRRDVVELPSLEDQPSRSVKNRLKSVHLVTRQTD